MYGGLQFAVCELLFELDVRGSSLWCIFVDETIPCNLSVTFRISQCNSIINGVKGNFAGFCSSVNGQQKVFVGLFIEPVVLDGLLVIMSSVFRVLGLSCFVVILRRDDKKFN